MKLLIFGGTLFVGRHMVEAALARGHEVTLFNRGVTYPDLFPNVEKIKGDRFVDLSPLNDRRWDAVLDPVGYSPKATRASVEFFGDTIDHYTYVSSNNAYADVGDTPVDENSKVNESVENTDDRGFGGDLIVQEVMRERGLVYRAGLIVGPHDRTDRLTYWARRISQGGRVLVPGYPERPQQIIDVRDLTEWNIRMVEAGQGGLYNTEGPDYQLTMGRMLDECKTVTGSDAELVWVDRKFLNEQGERSFDGMPPWLEDPEGLIQMNCKKAIKAGLTFRPLADIISDSLKWDTERDLDAPLPFGLPVRVGPSLQREKELLEAWDKR